MPAFLIGSIGVIAETSHLQRAAFNEAFAEAGLSWHWSEAEYAELLETAGGRQRIETHAEAQGETVDAEALHARKSALFQERLNVGVPPRDGVTETLAAMRDAGWSLGFVTATSAENVAAILSATGLDRDMFDVIVDKSMVTDRKPAPDVYLHALEALGASASESLAIEDNPDGVTAARAAGLTCFAYPGALHDPSTLGHADRIVERLTPQDALAASAA